MANKLIPKGFDFLKGVVQKIKNAGAKARGPTELISPVPDEFKMVSQTKPSKDYKKIYELGYKKYQAKGGYANVPMASMSAELNQLENEAIQKYPNYPRYTVPALSLKESSGGVRMRGNNPLGIGPGVVYPDLATSILGGGPSNQRGFKGVLFGNEKEPSKYKRFLQSGNYADLFGTYTPARDTRNASIKNQEATMNQLRDYWLQAEKELYPTQ